MKKVKRIAIAAIVIVLICLACFFIGKAVGGMKEERELSAVVLQNQLTEISEYASMTYAYTNMAQFESSKEFYGMTLPFTTKSFIITYDGEIKAGVDLTKAEIAFRGKTVTVTLPEAEILSHEIDEDSIEVFDETNSIFNPLKITDVTAFDKDQKAEMAKKAEEKGLLIEAKEKAISGIRGLLAQSLSKNYTLEVK